MEIALRARASCQEDGCANKTKFVNKRKTSAMTQGTDCTAAIVTRVVWVGVRGGGLVVGYLVTPGPGQPPALTPARQPLMGNSLTPSLQVLARRKKKSGVSEDFSTFKKGYSEDLEVQKVPTRK
jgi:hypothetical protein